MQFKGLKANGAFIENHGELTVEGIETGAAGLTLTNAGTAHIDAEQVLPKTNEGDPENTARIATDIMPAKEKEVAMILATADPRAKPEVFTSANPMPTSGPAYPLYKNKFKDFLQSTAEGQRFIQEVLAGDVNKMPYNFSAFRADNVIEKYKAWYCENYTIPAAIASTVAEILEQKGELQQKAIDAREREAELELIPSPEAHPDNSPVDESLPDCGPTLIDKCTKFLSFLKTTAEGRRFLAEEYQGTLPASRGIFNSRNPIKKYKFWFRENYEIPAAVASSVAEILEQRSELKRRAIEAREAELSLIPSPESHPDNSPMDDSPILSTTIYKDKTTKFLAFLNTTAEGRRFLAEEYPVGFPIFPINLHEFNIVN